MFTIKKAAEQVGVSVSTLRAWERRYGVGSPRRTDSGYRLYDDQAVRALSVMQALVAEGWSVRAAAEETLRRASAPVASPVAGPGAGRTLLEVAESFDVAGLTAILDERFSTASFEAVVDGWLLPALRDLGAGWESGRVTVAGEHLVAHAVARRLAAAYDAAGSKGTGPEVVLGLPPGATHELGLLAFATAARRAGLSTTYLGADVPAVDWAAAVATPTAAGAVLSVPTPADADAVEDAVTAIRERAPGVLVAVGGGAQDLAPEGCVRLGHEIGPGVALLLRSLRRPPA